MQHIAQGPLTPCLLCRCTRVRVSAIVRPSPLRSRVGRNLLPSSESRDRRARQVDSRVDASKPSKFWAEQSMYRDEFVGRSSRVSDERSRGQDGKAIHGRWTADALRVQIARRKRRLSSPPPCADGAGCRETGLRREFVVLGRAVLRHLSTSGFADCVKLWRQWFAYHPGFGTVRVEEVRIRGKLPDDGGKCAHCLAAECERGCDSALVRRRV